LGYAGLSPTNIERITIVFPNPRGLAGSASGVLQRINPSSAGGFAPPPETKGGRSDEKARPTHQARAVTDEIQQVAHEAEAQETGKKAQQPKSDEKPKAKQGGKQGGKGGPMGPTKGPKDEAVPLTYYILVTTKKPYDLPAVEGTFGVNGVRREFNGKRYVAEPL